MFLAITQGIGRDELADAREAGYLAGCFVVEVEEYETVDELR